MHINAYKCFYTCPIIYKYIYRPYIYICTNILCVLCSVASCMDEVFTE